MLMASTFNSYTLPIYDKSCWLYLHQSVFLFYFTSLQNVHRGFHARLFHKDVHIFRRHVHTELIVCLMYQKEVREIIEISEQCFD